ncbi:hypothetical protein ACFP1Z_11935 [Streptomyces gamaensis]|uniref:DUF3592 domain-containing protein n=1 Tax=Streptomyces gamaensis TaxID=1763542 RepID=A0ABW0YZE0_9ACTN
MSARPPGPESGPESGSCPGGARGAGSLVRPCDRVRRWFTGLLLAGTCVAAPAAGAVAGLGCYRAELRAVDPDAGVYAADARLTRDAGGDAFGGRSPRLVTVPVSWTAPDGTVRTASVKVDPGSPRGAGVRVWVARDGSATASPPRTAAQAATAAWLAAGGAAAGVPLLAWGGWRVFVLVTDRRRAAQWEAEWRQKEPEMSGRVR